MFDHPEHDLTNASSHRSIKMGTCQESKIEKTKEDEKHIDGLLISPRLQKGCHDRRTDTETEMNTQLEEQTD